MSHTKILKNAGAQFMGKIGTVITSFLVVNIVSGFGADFYGKYVTSYEYLAFFGIIADAGLFSIAVREMAKKPDKSNFILGNIFSMRLLLITAVTIIAGLSAQLIPSYPPEVKIGIWIAGISMALSMIAGTLSSILQARMKIQYFSLSLFSAKAILAILIFSISQIFGADKSPTWLLFSFLWAGVISNIIFSISVFFFAKKEIYPQKISLRFNFDWWKKIFKISLPYGLALILQTLYLRVDVILISIILGTSSAGIYGLATRVLESFLVLGVFFGQAFLPKISEEEHNKKAIAQSLSWGIEKLLILALPIMIGTIFFSTEIITLLSSNPEEFLSSSIYWGSDLILKILVPTVIFAFLNQLFTFTLVAENRQNFLMMVNGIALFINVALNILFLKDFGILIAAISTIFCEIVVFTFLINEIYQYFRPTFARKNLVIILIANLFLIAEYMLINNLIIAVVVGITTYFGFLFFHKEKFLQH